RCLSDWSSDVCSSDLTLCKLRVEGPDAASFLERLYPNRFGDLRPGRIRYGVLGSDAGRIMDDGTIACLGDGQFYVTTTSTGADRSEERRAGKECRTGW